MGDIDEMINNISEAIPAAQAGNQEGLNYIYYNTYKDQYTRVYGNISNIEMAEKDKEKFIQDILKEAYEFVFTNIKYVTNINQFDGWLVNVVDDIAARKVAELEADDDKSAAGGVIVGASAGAGAAVGGSAAGNVLNANAATAMNIGAVGSQAGEMAGNAIGTATGKAMAGNGVAGSMTEAGVGKAAVGAGKVMSAKVGMSIGAKFAIGIIGTATIIGLSVGAFKLIDSDNKEKIVPTETTSESEQEDTSDGSEMTSEAVTEEDTENVDTVARYTAYYGVVKDYMEQYPAAVDYAIDNGWTYSEIKGFSSAQLIDFNGDGSEQLVLSHFDGKDAGTCGIDVYDYQNETAELIASYTANETLIMPKYGSEVSFRTEKLNDGTYVLGIREESGVKNYAYEAGTMKEVPYDSISKSVQTEHINYMYYYSVGALSRADEIRQIEDSLILKHKTITEIAEKSGDDTFINTVSEPEIAFDAGSGAKTQVNKYNETYNMDFYGNMNAQLSANGKTISYDESIEGTVYVSYMDDMLVIPYMIVGTYDTSVSEYVISGYWWRLPLEECSLETNKFTMNKYEEIAEDEFNSRINALLND